ncbi:MAG: acyltransferase family protein [Fibrobacteres bacterium]|nr:acyltransferase family protein [Fibrobacterota bacterium]
MEEVKKKRSQVVDVAKGIAILSVVVLHSWYCANGTSYLSRWIGGFQLPLFFFIGGLFFRYDNWKEIIRSRIDSLIKPLLVVACLWLPVGLTFGRHWNERHLNIHLDLFQSGIIYLASFLVGVPVFTETWGLIQMNWGFGPTWFIVHLFGLHLLCLGLAKLVRWDNHQAFKGGAIVVVMLALFFIQTIFLATAFHVDWEGVRTMGAPLHLDLALLTGAFFLAGNLMVDRIRGMRGSVLLTIVSIIIYSALVWALPTDFSMFWRSFVNLPAILIIAAVGIFAGMQSSALFARIPRVSDALAFIGSRSLYILMFHTLIYFLAWTIGEKIRLEKTIAATGAIVFAVVGSLALSEVFLRIPLAAKLMYPKQK